MKKIILLFSFLTAVSAGAVENEANIQGQPQDAVAGQELQSLDSFPLGYQPEVRASSPDNNGDDVKAKQLGNKCCTYAGWCYLDRWAWQGQACYCRTWGGRVWGRVCY